MSSKPKIGAEHFSAFLRQGLHELRAGFYTDSNIAQSPEQGLFGTKTPGEVAQDRRDTDGDPNKLRSTLNEKLQELQGLREDADPGQPGMDLDQ